jgi:polar amino acid transport system permease protein
VRKGDSAKVTLRNDAGDEQHLTVDENSLQFAQGDDVAEGDVVGVTRHWAAGPLLWGLWTTLWLSVVSGVLGLLIGLVTGLCRLSSNPTLRDLSTSTSNWCAARRCWCRSSFSTSSSAR